MTEQTDQELYRLLNKLNQIINGIVIGLFIYCIVIISIIVIGTFT